MNGVGSVTFSCTATDHAGNTAVATVAYSVVYGGSSGIEQPIDPDNKSVFKRGRAVPVKFRLAGDPPSGFVTTGFTIQRIQTGCAEFDAVNALYEEVPSNTPSSLFRYDPESDLYIYNADFSGVASGTCWRVKVSLDDGVSAMYSGVFKVT